MFIVYAYAVFIYKLYVAFGISYKGVLVLIPNVLGTVYTFRNVPRYSRNFQGNLKFRELSRTLCRNRPV